MSNPNDRAWLAFDVGAKSHAWASEANGHREEGTVENTPQALESFLKSRLRRGDDWQVLVEATGLYFLDVALLAHECGAQVAVVNPRTTHHFAAALNQRNKTDRLDARMLLQCLKRMPFRAWQPPRKAWLDLRCYGRFLVQLTEMGTAAKNRLHALSSTQASPGPLRTEIKHMIQDIDRRIERMRTKAIALIRKDRYLIDRFDALCTVPGIAATSAASLLSELVALPPGLSGRACVCHAGLDPRVFESGTSVHKAPRISRRGNKYLRRALYYPAQSAAVHDASAHAFRDRLVARGKKPMQAIVAIMRKMLTAIWAIMKNPSRYDASRLYPSTEIA